MNLEGKKDISPQFWATSEAAVWARDPTVQAIWGHLKGSLLVSETSSGKQRLLVIQRPIRSVFEYLYPQRLEVLSCVSSWELVKVFLSLVVVIVVMFSFSLDFYLKLSSSEMGNTPSTPLNLTLAH